MLETEYFMNGFHGESFLEEVSVPSNKVVSVCHWRFTLAVLVTFCENTVWQTSAKDYIFTTLANPLPMNKKT